MKSILTVLLALTLSFGFAQSITEKYNSLYERYEYFDESGNLIGYKKWDSLRKQWEYHEVSRGSKKNTNGNYVSPINLELVNSTLQKRQAKYDKNKRYIYNHLEKLRNQIFNHFTNTQDRNEALNQMSNLIENFNKGSKKYDFSKTNEITTLVSGFNELYYDIIKHIEGGHYKEIGNNENGSQSLTQSNNSNVTHSKNKTYEIIENELDNSPPPEYIEKYKLKYDTETHLLNSPSYNAKKVTRISKENIVYLIKEKVKENNYYYKVYANGYYGYIIGDLIDKNLLPDKEKNEITSNLEPVMLGGYRTNTIKEYRYDMISRKYILDSDENIDSQLYFEKDRYSFKRGNNEWLGSDLKYLGFQKEFDGYTYLDNYNQIIVISKDLKQISWLSLNKSDRYQNVYVYGILIKDESVISDW